LSQCAACKQHGPSFCNSVGQKYRFQTTDNEQSEVIRANTLIINVYHNAIIDVYADNERKTLSNLCVHAYALGLHQTGLPVCVFFAFFRLLVVHALKAPIYL